MGSFSAVVPNFLSGRSGRGVLSRNLFLAAQRLSVIEAALALVAPLPPLSVTIGCSFIA